MNKQIAALATDTEHMVMWDMDALLSDYKDQPYLTVDTDVLIPQEWLTIDTSYAMTTDVSKPIILFEIPNDQLYIADGNHRLYRAASEHIRKMNIVIIPQEKHLSYLFRCSTDRYYRVMESLNHEGIFINDYRIN